MSARRLFLATLAACLITPLAWAAPPAVEIIAMAHPPVVAALQPLRDWLSRQGGKLKVVEIDAESPTGTKRLRAAGFTGHIPILILIDGQHVFPRTNGGQAAFVKFPNAPGSPPGMRGDWETADVQAVLLARMK